MRIKHDLARVRADRGTQIGELSYKWVRAGQLRCDQVGDRLDASGHECAHRPRDIDRVRTLLGDRCATGYERRRLRRQHALLDGLCFAFECARGAVVSQRPPALLCDVGEFVRDQGAALQRVRAVATRREGDLVATRDRQGASIGDIARAAAAGVDADIAEA
ncbi:hypothetical protein QFW81_07070 [Luteimonas sp. M1R5S59]|uniref:Uncharacterized protein n=1 Tax=Luteimonas kalidii TaxID=3042025 RepID=A0ABT6JSV9_9GAMM|nr:hypothetical protein [Luteimonas kalidii]MDH5833684.1 hypothetical protein [Luteimonas kalidii]